jgi:quercetin dioxygenase-like cupin family protein
MALHHARPGETVHLASVVSDDDAKTSALIKTDSFEAMQLVLRAGEEISNHSVPGYAIVHCLEGRAILKTAEPIQLAAGDWLYFDRGQKHSVSAIEDSSLLLTVIFD